MLRAGKRNAGEGGRRRRGGGGEMHTASDGSLDKGVQLLVSTDGKLKVQGRGGEGKGARVVGTRISRRVFTSVVR